MKPPNFHFYKPFSVFTHLSLSLSIPIYLLIYLYLSLYLSLSLFIHTHTQFSASKRGLSIIIFRFTFHPMPSHASMFSSKLEGDLRNMFVHMAVKHLPPYIMSRYLCDGDAYTALFAFPNLLANTQPPC